MHVKEGEFELSLEAKGSFEKKALADSPVMKELSEISLEETIDAPMVGTFYRSASPTEKPFVEAGDRVKKGDTLCIIEAMKVMNEIKADRDLLICKVVAKDGETVEFGKTLFIVE